MTAKRTLTKSAWAVLLAFDANAESEMLAQALTRPMDALRESLRIEKVAASERARASADRRLTPEQRETRIVKAQTRIDRLAALNKGLDGNT